MNNKNLALTMVLALVALTTVAIVERFLMTLPTEAVQSLESEGTVTPEEPKDLEDPKRLIIITPVKPVEEPAPPLPPESDARPYNPLYQYGYGEPNEPEVIPEAPIDPRKRLLKDGWVITIEPNGALEPVVEPAWIRKLRKAVKKRRDALKALEEEWKHRA